MTEAEELRRLKMDVRTLDHTADYVRGALRKGNWIYALENFERIEKLLEKMLNRKFEQSESPFTPRETQ